MKNVLIFVVGLILIALTGTGIAQEPQSIVAQWPSHCHALARTESALRSDHSLSVAQQQVFEPQLKIAKYNIVCISDEIIVDTPIYSNGGDIVILARSVQLRNKIDTRIYRKDEFMAKFHPYDPFDEALSKSGEAKPGIQVAGGWAHTGKALIAVHSDKGNKFRKAFEDYYACHDCRTINGMMVSPRLPDGLTLPTWAWYLAQPHVQSYGARAFDGTPPPDDAIDFDVYRSGSVRIYAEKIGFGPLGEIDVRGAGGGRGGAGTPDPCVTLEYTGFNRFDCLGSRDTSSGRSASGGKGGNAGNVYIGYSETADFARLQRISRVEGGKNGGGTIYRSPFTFGAKPYSGSIADFTIVGEGVSSSDGEDGNLLVTQLRNEVMMRAFVADLTSYDADPSYDYSEFISRARDNGAQDVVSFADYFSREVSEQHRLGLLTLVDRAEELLLKSSGRLNAVPSKILCSSHENLPERYKAQLQRLFEVCSNRSNMLATFVYRNGGLGNIERNDVLADLSRDNLRNDILGGVEIWNSILAAQYESQEILMSIYFSVEADRLSRELRDAKKELVELRVRIDALKAVNKGKRGFEILLRTVGKMSYVADLADAIENWLVEMNLPKLEKIGKRIPKANEASRDFIALFQHKNAALAELQGKDEDLAALDFAIAALSEKLIALSREMALRKENALNRAQALLLKTVYSRAFYSDFRRSRLQQVGDLLKGILLDRLSGGEAANTRLSHNLTNLKIFLSAHDVATPTFSLPPLPSCKSIPRLIFFDRCPRLPAQSSYILLSPEILSENGRPLLYYQYSETQRGRIVESFNLPVLVRHGIYLPSH